MTFEVHILLFKNIINDVLIIFSGRDIQHNISFSVYDNNRQGALSYYSVGEVNPIITIDKNRILNNCEKLYGNFSTCQASVSLDIQNTQTIFFRVSFFQILNKKNIDVGFIIQINFQSNLIQGNEGGLSVRADSRGSATSLKGWIHNNLFYANRNLPALKVEGQYIL